jgi:hypothetical protein
MSESNDASRLRRCFGGRIGAEMARAVGRGDHCIYKSTVRTSMVLERQAPAARDRIHEAIHDSAERFAQDGAYEIAWLAVLAAARKPRS